VRRLDFSFPSRLVLEKKGKNQYQKRKNKNENTMSLLFLQQNKPTTKKRGKEGDV